MKKIVYIFLVSLSLSLHAQEKENFVFELGTEIPLNYSMGVVLAPKDNVQVNLRGGVLTKPYDALIFNLLELFGTDEALTNTIGNAFTNGAMLKAGLNYNLNGFYCGIFYSYFRLNAMDVPTDLINNYYGLNIPTSQFFDLIEYKLRSDLHSLGLVVGKSFPLSDAVSFGTEFSIAKSIKSINSISSTYDDDMVLASEIIHGELEPYYKKYGYLPSLNVFIRFGL